MQDTNGYPNVLGIQFLVEESHQSEHKVGKIRAIEYGVVYSHFKALRFETSGWIRRTTWKN